MNFGKRKDTGKWYASDLSEITGKRIQRQGATKSEAKKRLLEAIEDEKRGVKIQKDLQNITLSDYFLTIEERRAETGELKPATIADNQRSVSRINPFLGHKKVREITADEVLSMRRKWRKGDKDHKPLAERTINKTIAYLRLVLDEALLTDRIIAFNPVNRRSVKKLKVKSNIQETVHRKPETWELEKLFTVMEEQEAWYLQTFQFCLFIGDRGGETAGLRWSDIDYKSKLIHIRGTASRMDNSDTFERSETTKTGKPRSVNLTPAVRLLLNQQRQKLLVVLGEEATEPDAWVFPRMDGSMANAKIYGDSLSHWCKQAGIERLGTHSFRVAYASYADANGIPLKATAKQLGHSRTETTLKYYIVDDSVPDKTTAEQVEKVLLKTLKQA